MFENEMPEEESILFEVNENLKKIAASLEELVRAQQKIYREMKKPRDRGRRNHD